MSSGKRRSSRGFRLLRGRSKKTTTTSHDDATTPAMPGSGDVIDAYAGSKHVTSLTTSSSAADTEITESQVIRNIKANNRPNHAAKTDRNTVKNSTLGNNFNCSAGDNRTAVENTSAEVHHVTVHYGNNDHMTHIHGNNDHVTTIHENKNPPTIYNNKHTTNNNHGNRPSHHVIHTSHHSSVGPTTQSSDSFTVDDSEVYLDRKLAEDTALQRPAAPAKPDIIVENVVNSCDDHEPLLQAAADPKRLQTLVRKNIYIKLGC